MMKRSLVVVAGALTLLATPAFAHTGVGHASGLMAGVAHPLSGLDHMLAMLAVGVLAVQQGGKARWVLPLGFVAMLVVGFSAGASGLALPMVELGIMGSVVMLGLVVALGKQLPLAMTLPMVALFALFHGHAHGTEMPLSVSGVEYALGFALASVALHGAGMSVALFSQKLRTDLAPLALRLAGVAMAVTGLGMLAA